MRIFNNKTILLAGCGLAALALPAQAQENAEDDGVIVVTAQNRAQDVQDVPIAMEVLSADDLAQAGFSDANDLSQIAPVVQVNQDQGVVKISMRGVGTTSGDETQDTSVVVNIDGEYINRPNVLGVALFDLERVEVLRGPQGTLYGRNSTGGAVNFITRRPGTEFGANFSVSYGNYDEIRADAGIDLPLSSTAGLRVAGFIEDREGYVSHPAVPAFFAFPAFAGGRSDDNHAYGARATLGFDDGALSANLAGEFARRAFTPGAFTTTDLNAAGNGPTGPGCNAPGYVQVAPAYSQTLCVPQNTNFLEGFDRSNFAAPAFGLGRLGADTWAVRGRVAYEFGPEATLSYIAGYREYSGDADNYLTLPPIYRNYSFLNDIQTQSHELRLNGDLNGIIYQVGGFYFDEKIDSDGGFFLPAFVFGGSPVDPGTFLSYFGRHVQSESWSAFGQVEVPLSDTLTAVGGLRYTDNKRSAVYLNGSPFGMFGPDVGAPGVDPTDLSSYLFGSGPSQKDFTLLPYAETLLLGSQDDKITWLVGLNWNIDPDTLIYAKVSTGFKGGGFDSVGTYAPETNTAYEVGLKRTFGSSGQHIFNAGAFYYDYSGLQVNVLLDTTVGSQTFNAGAATIWGIELETSIELAEGTRFNGSFNYLNAEYDELFAQFNVYTVPGTGDDLNGIGDLDPNTAGVQQPSFAGNTPPFSPEFVITAGLEHDIDLGSAGMLTARADTTFKSGYYTTFYNQADGHQKSYFQTDASLQWTSENELVSLTAYVRNIENARPLTYGAFTSAGPVDIYSWQFGRPRTYGLRLAFEY